MPCVHHAIPQPAICEVCARDGARKRRTRNLVLVTRRAGSSPIAAGRGLSADASETAPAGAGRAGQRAAAAGPGTRAASVRRQDAARARGAVRDARPDSGGLADGGVRGRLRGRRADALAARVPEPAAPSVAGDRGDDDAADHGVPRRQRLLLVARRRVDGRQAAAAGRVRSAAIARELPTTTRPAGSPRRGFSMPRRRRTSCARPTARGATTCTRSAARRTRTCATSTRRWCARRRVWIRPVGVIGERVRVTIGGVSGNFVVDPRVGTTLVSRVFAAKAALESDGKQLAIGWVRGKVRRSSASRSCFRR